MKKISLLILALMCVICLTSCGNYEMFDTTYTFKKVHTTFDGVEYKCYEINSWTDYEGEQIQVDIKDYGTVLLSSVNSYLIADKCPYCDANK